MGRNIVIIAVLLILLVGCVNDNVVDVTPFNELTLKKNACSQDEEKIVEEAQELTIINNQKLKEVKKMIETAKKVIDTNNKSQQNEIEKRLESGNQGLGEIKNKLIERESKLVECLGYLREMDDFIEDNYIQLEKDGQTPQLKRENIKISIKKYEEMIVIVRKSIFKTELALS